MPQLPLPSFGDVMPLPNVASIPQRSPFRYAGGKTWLIPQVRQWLKARPELPSHLIEPFAGGAIVGLTALCEQLCDRLCLIELDDDVASVWQAIFTDGDAEWLAEQIVLFDLNEMSIQRLLESPPASNRIHALQTIVRNRVNRGGILAPGAGRMKLGEQGRGMASRWYPHTLARRIRELSLHSERVQFIQGDGLEVIQKYASNAQAVFFIDPPYSASQKSPGKRLYTHWQLDHERLFELVVGLAGDFLMTYNDDGAIRMLAQRHHLEILPVVMKTTHHTQRTELLIGRDLRALHP